eukprot:804815-Pelagomonas_calceolata.AAC.15
MGAMIVVTGSNCLRCKWEAPDLPSELPAVLLLTMWGTPGLPSKLPAVLLLKQMLLNRSL